jgi:hypothetical protein
MARPQMKWTKRNKNQEADENHWLDHVNYHSMRNTTLFQWHKQDNATTLEYFLHSKKRLYRNGRGIHHCRKCNQNNHGKYWHNTVFYHVWITSDFLVGFMYLTPTHGAIAILDDSTFLVGIGIVGFHDCLSSYHGVWVFYTGIYFDWFLWFLSWVWGVYCNFPIMAWLFRLCYSSYHRATFECIMISELLSFKSGLCSKFVFVVILHHLFLLWYHCST